MLANKNRLVLAVVAIALALGSSGCMRSLSTPPAATPTLINFNVTPIASVNPIDALATQAAARTPGAATATATSTAASPAVGGGNEITPEPSRTPTATLPLINAPTSTATLPVVVVPSSTPGRPGSYTLQHGEWPWCIARRFNVNQYDLLTLNNLTEAQSLSLPAGTTLKIPQSGSFVGSRALIPHPANYTVGSADETFNSIACKYGDVEPSAIAIANNLPAGSVLRSGQVLRIP